MVPDYIDVAKPTAPNFKRLKLRLLRTTEAQLRDLEAFGGQDPEPVKKLEPKDQESLLTSAARLLELRRLLGTLEQIEESFAPKPVSSLISSQKNQDRKVN